MRKKTHWHRHNHCVACLAQAEWGPIHMTEVFTAVGQTYKMKFCARELLIIKGKIFKLIKNTDDYETVDIPEGWMLKLRGSFLPTPRPQ